MSSSLNRFTEANRAAWNEAMPYHQRAAKARWDAAFQQPGYVCLDDTEVTLLQQIGIQGRAVAHLCCNNGIELLSLKNLGAGECVGFDISDLAIQEAQERAQRCGTACQFVRTDVYEIGSEYGNRFDMVYVSAGGLGWLPDLPRFFAHAAVLLREGGRVFIHEIHPFSEMLPFDESNPADPLRLVEPYFKPEPYVEYGNLDYVGGTRYTSSKPQYWFVHTLSEIVMGLIGSGMVIEHLSEYEEDISAGHRRVEEARAGVPLSYILVGRKQGNG